MFRNLFVLLALAVVIALPFIFRQPAPAGDWREGEDPKLVMVSPHSEAIRYEFAIGFSKWHAAHFKRRDGSPEPVKIDWLSVGGTTEINRYLTAAYTTATRAWWQRQGREWPDGATDALTAKAPPADPKLLEIYNALRTTDQSDQDKPAAISIGIDVLFGGGQFDHTDLHDRGATVPPFDDKNPPPAGLFSAADGAAEMPEKMSGEVWRTPFLFGSAVSTFGICSNVDRLKDLGIATPPSAWTDLADQKYFRQVGLADPTKSGSISKAFELLIHQQIHSRVIKTGFSEADIDAMEKFIAATKWKPGTSAPGMPPRIEVYQACIESGWIDGIHLVQQIGANARYFTDSASKVPIDVSAGDATVGMCIDFYGRFQAQSTRSPEGVARMVYVSPPGGTSVSCDPISLLRGAPSRDLAVQFIEFSLGEEGQKLWCYRVGEPGGPEKYALRRLPLRRDFYPSTDPAMREIAADHAMHASDSLSDPAVDPYALAKLFNYHPRWTAALFGVQGSIIRAMCMDSADELRGAWQAIKDAGGPTACPQAMAKLGELPAITLDASGPIPLTWSTAPGIAKNYQPLDFMREWIKGFRANYTEARALAEKSE